MIDQLFPKALTVVKNNLEVNPGEEVLILIDGSVSAEVLTAFRLAVTEAGASVSVQTYEPLSYHPVSEHCRFAGASLRQSSLRLPRPVMAAISAADAVLIINSELELLFVPTLRELFTTSQIGKTEQRVRVINIPMLTGENMERLMPESSEEVGSVHATTIKGGKLMSEASRARITTPAGTDLSMSLGQYHIILHHGIVGPGTLQVLPAGQVTRVPNDNSAEGVLVIDRTVAAYDYKALSEPITFVVERGDVVDVKGGVEAARMCRFLESFDDPNMYHVTELAFGTNPRCRIIGVAPPCEDTHTHGCVSLALGTDVHIGGSVRSHAHCDMTMEAASLELDGRMAVQEGKISY